MKKTECKIYIWSGTWDSYYLHIETYEFEVEASLRMKNPKSDAVFEYSLFCSHCEMFSQRRILEQIAEKLNEMNTE